MLTGRQLEEGRDPPVGREHTPGLCRFIPRGSVAGVGMSTDPTGCASSPHASMRCIEGPDSIP
jgi:hypothetical protein